MRWRDRDGDYSWTLKIMIRRSGPEASPVDRYAVTGRGTPGRDRRLAGWSRRAVRESGRLVVQTRRATIGDHLELLWQGPGEAVRVAVLQPVDPVMTGDFDEPPVGSRYVGFPMSLTNVGRERFDDSLRNGARLITDEGATIRPDILVTGNCTEGSVDIPAGGTRVACIAFAVPFTALVAAFEYRPNSGYAPETGEWDIPEWTADLA